MFNFTTLTVYNSISTTGANKNMWVVTGKKPSLRIGNTRFDAADVLDIYKKSSSKEALASVTFDMAKIIPTGDKAPEEVTARIALYVGLSMNSQDALYANPFVYKGKPLFIEFFAKKGESADVVAKRVKAIANKYLLFIVAEKILDVSIDTAAAGENTDAKGLVTFTGVNGYQIIKKAVLQKYDPEAKTIDCCSTEGDFVDVIKGVQAIYTINNNGDVVLTDQKMGEDGQAEDIADNEVAIAPGLEAFGDYNWIIHNLRLPTQANTNFWAPSKRMDEMPVPGQTYTQYIIRLKKERDGIMGEIVGARGTTVTTHVLYVATSFASAVETELAKLGTINSDADAILKDPYHTN